MEAGCYARGSMESVGVRFQRPLLPAGRRVAGPRCARLLTAKRARGSPRACPRAGRAGSSLAVRAGLTERGRRPRQGKRQHVVEGAVFPGPVGGAGRGREQLPGLCLPARGGDAGPRAERGGCARARARGCGRLGGRQCVPQSGLRASGPTRAMAGRRREGAGCAPWCNQPLGVLAAGLWGAPPPRAVHHPAPPLADVRDRGLPAPTTAARPRRIAPRPVRASLLHRRACRGRQPFLRELKSHQPLQMPSKSS